MSRATTNRLTIAAGYWTVRRDCCDWTDNAARDEWHPQPGVGWVCPKCAAPAPKLYMPPKRLTVRQRLRLLWFWFVDGGDAR